MRMHANDTNQEEKIIHKELSYKITGLLFEVHNALGRFGRERQYADVLEQMLREANMVYMRESSLPIAGIKRKDTNRADFVVENKILLECKAKPIISKEDYAQIQRYLQAGGYKLGLLVNFRNRYLKPIRVIRTNL